MLPSRTTIRAFHSDYLDRMLCIALYSEVSYTVDIQFNDMTTSDKSDSSKRKEEETTKVKVE